MKTFNRIMLVLLVVAFPLASWYYLNTGLNFRKKALEELTPKGIFTSANSSFTDLISGKTAVIFMDENLENDMKVIYSQYKDSESFSLIKVGQDSSEKEEWITHALSQSMVDSIFNNDKKVILIDTSLQIRQIYNDKNYNPGRLVEHLSIILPRSIEPDIKVRNNKNAGE